MGSLQTWTSQILSLLIVLWGLFVRVLLFLIHHQLTWAGNKKTNLPSISPVQWALFFKPSAPLSFAIRVAAVQLVFSCLWTLLESSGHLSSPTQIIPSFTHNKQSAPGPRCASPAPLRCRTAGACAPQCVLRGVFTLWRQTHRCWWFFKITSLVGQLRFRRNLSHLMHVIFQWPCRPFADVLLRGVPSQTAERGGASSAKAWSVRCVWGFSEQTGEGLGCFSPRSPIRLVLLPLVGRGHQWPGDGPWDAPALPLLLARGREGTCCTGAGLCDLWVQMSPAWTSTRLLIPSSQTGGMDQGAASQKDSLNPVSCPRGSYALTELCPAHLCCGGWNKCWWQGQWLDQIFLSFRYMKLHVTSCYRWSRRCLTGNTSLGQGAAFSCVNFYFIKLFRSGSVSTPYAACTWLFLTLSQIWPKHSSARTVYCSFLRTHTKKHM